MSKRSRSRSPRRRSRSRSRDRTRRERSPRSDRHHNRDHRDSRRGRSRSKSRSRERDNRGSRRDSPKRDDRSHRAQGRDRSPARDKAFSDRDKRDREKNDKMDMTGDSKAGKADSTSSKMDQSQDQFAAFQKALESKMDLRKDTPVGKGAAPVSLETLEEMAKKKAESDQLAMKPVFLSKKQREELALQKLAAQRQAESAAKDEVQQMIEDSRQRRERERQERETQRQKEREDREKSKDAREREKNSTVIKETYLGKTKAKKKVVPPSQKFKFSFDWEANDDTSVDNNPLYAKRLDVGLLYGRGFIAGVDRREQRKQHKFYDDLINARSKGQDALVALRDADKVAKREAAERSKEEKKALLNRHWREKPLVEMEERDWRIFREDFNITTRGNRVPHPIRFWNEAELPPILLAQLAKAGYKEPTPIQRASIPCGLRNMDLVGIAETGSGKTCAFVVPMLVYISTLPPCLGKQAENGPYAIVLAPTRELAQQTSEECDKLGKEMGIRNVSIVGGNSIEEQGVSMREGVEIVVATPGRLYDAIERRYLVLNQCNYVVLDEADRMIDLNFEPQLIKILDSMPSSNLRPENPEQVDEKKVYRQTTMFSATMPVKVENLAKKYLRHPVIIQIGDRGSAKAASTVTQRVEMITEGRKKQRLLEILHNEEPPFIVFCNSKKACDALGRTIENDGINVTVLHGGKIQDAREDNLAKFKTGEYDVLVATDVVGRGIDISGVQQVINYDMPSEIEKYTHRIGRTGRAGNAGLATSFVTDADTGIYFDLKNLLEASNQEVPPELARHEAAKQKPGAPGDKPKRQTTIFAK